MITSPILARLIAIVEAADGHDESVHQIESARDDVRPEHIAALVDLYGRLTTWTQRAALVEVIQDHAHPASLPVMKQFLAAVPAVPGDEYDHPLAIAAAHVAGDLTRFDHYYDNPGALAEAREAARGAG